jgi:hypothetical protein
MEKGFLNVQKMSHFTNLPLNCAQLGDPLESRQKEEELRGPAVMELTYCINSFREAAQSKDAKFDHIDAADKEKVCALPHEIQFLCIKLFSLLLYKHITLGCINWLSLMVVCHLFHSFHYLQVLLKAESLQGLFYRLSVNATRQKIGTKTRNNNKMLCLSLQIQPFLQQILRRKQSFWTGI